MGTHFSASSGEPGSPNYRSEEQLSQFFQDLDDRVGKYSEEVAQASAEHFIDTRESRIYPMLVEIKRILGKYHAEKNGLKKSKYSETEWSESRIKRATELCKQSELGKEAWRDGWYMLLWHYVRQKDNLPGGTKVDEVRGKLKREADRLTRSAETALDRGHYAMCGIVIGMMRQAGYEKGYDEFCEKVALKLLERQIKPLVGVVRGCTWRKAFKDRALDWHSKALWITQENYKNSLTEQETAVI